MKMIFEVCIRWADDDDEQGTYTGQVETNSRDDAITAIARDMALSRDGRGPEASEAEIQAFIEGARTRVNQAWSITEHVFNDLHMILEEELQGRRIDPKALVDLITENLEQVAPSANPSAPDSTAVLSKSQGLGLVSVLADLVQAVDFTPLGTRGIKAVAAAKAALGDVPGSGYAKLTVEGRFSATWSEAFANGPETRTVTGDFFTQDAGYDWQDVVGLAALGIGQTWKGRHYGPAHTVTRLPDTE